MEYCIMPPKIIVRQAASELSNCYKNPLVKLPVEAHFHSNKIGWALQKRTMPNDRHNIKKVNDNHR